MLYDPSVDAYRQAEELTLTRHLAKVPCVMSGRE